MTNPELQLPTVADLDAVKPGASNVRCFALRTPSVTAHALSWSVTSGRRVQRCPACVARIENHMHPLSTMEPQSHD